MYLRRMDTARVANSIEAWCRDELAHSSRPEDRNAITADFDSLVTGFGAEFDPGNPVARKAFSHASRAPGFIEAYLHEPTDDYQAGKLAFHALMELSGSQKLFLATEAENAEDFTEKLLGDKPLSVWTASVTAQFITDERFISESLAYKQEQVAEKVVHAHDFALTSLERIIRLPRMHPEAIKKARAVQACWLRTVVFIVDMLAHERDSLDVVPVLEPKSITDEPDVIYPFKK